MPELPLLVVHGPWIWKVLLVVGTAATLFGCGAIRRWWVRVGTQTEVRDQRGLALSAPVAEARRLRGTLRGGTASTFRRYGTLTLRGIEKHERAAVLWLECDGGERVELVGDVHVDIGSSVFERASDAPGLASQMATLRGPTQLRRVQDGDEVVVIGTVTGAPNAWQIASGRIVAVAAAVRPQRLALLGRALSIAACAAVTYLVLVGVGRTASTLVDETAFEPGVALQIAASMPRSREAALDRYRKRLTLAADRDVRAAHWLAALRWTQDGCDAAFEGYAKRHYFAEAVAQARRCGRPELAARAQLFLGAFHEMPAEAELEDLGRYAAAYGAIGRKDWVRAAQLLDHGGVAAECIAALMRVWATQPGAQEQLAKLAGTGRHAICAFAYGEVVPRSPAQALADEHWDFTNRGQSLEPVSLRAILDGHRLRRFEYATYVGDRFEDGAWALAPWLSAYPDAGHARATVLALRALHAHVVGNTAAAARDALASDAAQPVDELGHADSIAAWIAFRTGQPFEPRGFTLAAMAAMLAGTSADVGDPCREAASEAARTRDASPLLQRTCTTRTDELLAVLPRLTRRRAALVTALETLTDPTSSSRYEPFRWLEYVMNQRDVLRVAGSVRAQHWQRLLDSHLAALADRRVAIAFYLVGLLPEH